MQCWTQPGSPLTSWKLLVQIGINRDLRHFLSIEHVNDKESNNRSISAQCKPPGRTKPAGICKCTPRTVLLGTLSCHPLLESNDAVFHILKEAPQEVNAETILPYKSLLSYKVNQKKPGEQVDYLCMAYSMGYKAREKRLRTHKSRAIQQPCWLSHPPENGSIFFTV